jgi:hypothetical protein
VKSSRSAIHAYFSVLFLCFAVAPPSGLRYLSVNLCTHE